MGFVGLGLALMIKLALGIALVLLAWLIVVLSTYRGRRRIARFWKRTARWEFWPPYVFYPPVVLYIAYLGLKFRSWTLFTAANPAIPASGFVGESKNEILEQLRGASEWLPRFTLLRANEPAQRIAQAEEFMRQNRLEFPIVLKPDAGQRGSGVAIIRTSEELRDYLSQPSFATILQEYVARQGVRCLLLPLPWRRSRARVLGHRKTDARFDRRRPPHAGRADPGR